MKYMIFFLCLSMASCKKCYDCSKRCGTCTQPGFPPLAGCNGDESLNNFSVEAWKLYLEDQGYTCVLSEIKEETCDNADKELKQANNFNCVNK